MRVWSLPGEEVTGIEEAKTGATEMRISKSKRQLAQLLVEAGVAQFPEGANWAAQDKAWNQYAKCVMFYRGCGQAYSL